MAEQSKEQEFDSLIDEGLEGLSDGDSSTKEEVDEARRSRESSDIEDVETEEDKLERQVSTPEEREKNDILGRMLADPKVRAIVEASRDGRDVEIVDREELRRLRELGLKSREREQEQEKPESLEDVDLDDLSPKEFASFLLKQVKGVVKDELGTSLKGALDPIRGTVEEIEKERVAAAQSVVRRQVEECLKKYGQEFEQAGPDLLTMHRANPGLSVEELFLVHKRRNMPKSSGKQRKQREKSRPSAERERPSVSTARPSERETVARGEVGFDSLLQEALPEVLNELEL